MTVSLGDDAALLLDCDGTLLDLAATPDAVVVPPGLVDDLRRVRARLGGALAIVTGRPIAQIDALLADAPFAVAGEHGGALRHAPGEPVGRPKLPDLPPHWRAAAEAIAARHPGSLLEPKARGFVFHYRQVRQAGPPLHDAAQALVAEAGDAFVVMPAHMAWEVKPRGADKGTAVVQLMERPPFAGRRPLYIGDDVTDEDGMAAARTLGGQGLRVQDAFGTADGVRTWLREVAGRTPAAG